MIASRYFWLVLGLVSTGCGVIGAVLPLIPTTPFILLAAYAFAKSSPRFHGWLVNHRQFGPLIVNWQRNGSIDPTSKRLALMMMAAALATSWVLGASAMILAIQVAVLSASALFILTRPDGPARMARNAKAPAAQGKPEPTLKTQSPATERIPATPAPR